MSLDALAAVSDEIAATRSRTQKVELLSPAARELSRERETGVAWLSGVPAGGKLGRPAIGALPARRTAGQAATLTIGAASERLESSEVIRRAGRRAPPRGRAHRAVRARDGARAELSRATAGG
jgi:hypothetical protein